MNQSNNRYPKWNFSISNGMSEKKRIKATKTGNNNQPNA